MKNLLYFSLAVGIYWLFFLNTDHVSLGPGILAPEVPKQEKIEYPESFLFEGHTITPLARYELMAKVLSREDYFLGRESDLSPTDLVLGWGEMSNEETLETISIKQSNRWYRWYSDELPLPRRKLENSSANVHIIPSDGVVESALDRVRIGDIVTLSGSLVRVDSSDGWSWVSSLSRKDTGSGSCELIFVEDMSIENF